MRSRRTVRIGDLINEVNRRNAGSTCSPETRKGWNSLLEGVLSDANVYEGYSFVLGPDGKEDETRHHYYHHYHHHFAMAAKTGGVS